MTARRSGMARSLKETTVKHSDSVKLEPVRAKAGAHILSAAKGPRTVSHRQIKDAVDKVFRERAHTRG